MMDGQLKNGTILTSECGNKYKVSCLLGAGGQGEVYDVVCDGQHYALNGILRGARHKDRKKYWKRLSPRALRMILFFGRWS